MVEICAEIVPVAITLVMDDVFIFSICSYDVVRM